MIPCHAKSAIAPLIYSATCSALTLVLSSDVEKYWWRYSYSADTSVTASNLNVSCSEQGLVALLNTAWTELRGDSSLFGAFTMQIKKLKKTLGGMSLSKANKKREKRRVRGYQPNSRALYQSTIPTLISKFHERTTDQDSQYRILYHLACRRKIFDCNVQAGLRLPLSDNTSSRNSREPIEQACPVSQSPTWHVAISVQTMRLDKISLPPHSTCT